MGKPLRFHLNTLPALSSWITFLFPSQASSLFFKPPIHHLFLGASTHHQEVTFPRVLCVQVLSPVPDSKLLINKTIPDSYIHPAVNSPPQTAQVGTLLSPVYRHRSSIAKKAVFARGHSGTTGRTGTVPHMSGTAYTLDPNIMLPERRPHRFQAAYSPVSQNRSAHSVFVQMHVKT